MTEYALIGAMLIDPETEVDLSPEMFANANLGRLYYEITTDKADAQILTTRYANSKVMQMEILQCVDNAPATSIMAERYAKEIRNAWKKREADKILGSIRFDEGGIDDQIEDLRDRLTALTENRTNDGHTLGELSRMFKDKQFTDRPKIHLGFFRLDGIIGGFDRGDVSVIGARPSVGKTAFVLQIARQMVRKGLKVVIFNQEMEDEQMYQRFIAAESGIELNRIRNAKAFIGNEEKEKFEKANERIADNPLMLYTGVKTVREIRSLARGYDVVIVDYLQLIKCRSTYSGNRVQEVSEISRDMKEMAQEIHASVLLLSQLNRASEMKQKLSMADLRDSGAIEQDASVIMLMWENKSGSRSVSVEKNRQGAKGTIIFDFDGNKMRFTETGKDEEELIDECPFD